MAHGLVETIKTSLHVETVSASVKQQHYDSMFESMEQRHMKSKLTTMACEPSNHNIIQDM